MPDLSQYFPITSPTMIFFVVLCIILFAPIVMGKLRIPHIVGMVLAGVAVGPYGFNILAKDDSFELFGHVGLYYIMFLAGLEMNMANFMKNRVRTFTHGLMAFVIPMVMGFFVNRGLLGYSVGPIVTGTISDMFNLSTAMVMSSFVLLAGAIFYFICIFTYPRDKENATCVDIEFH